MHHCPVCGSHTEKLRQEPKELERAEGIDVNTNLLSSDTLQRLMRMAESEHSYSVILDLMAATFGVPRRLSLFFLKRHEQGDAKTLLDVSELHKVYHLILQMPSQMMQAVLDHTESAVRTPPRLHQVYGSWFRWESLRYECCF